MAPGPCRAVAEHTVDLVGPPTSLAGNVFSELSEWLAA
jgi:hypothetical protein